MAVEEFRMATQSLPLPAGIGGIIRAAARVPRPMLIAFAALVVAIAVALTLVARARTLPRTITTPVLQQTLAQSVTASGTVNPQNSISVGTQVSGTISDIYVDYNSKVRKGQVLARIDPSTIQAQLSQAQANYAQAQAQVAVANANASGAGSGVNVAQANAAAQNAAAVAAQANIAKAQSALTLAQQQLQRDQTLFAQGYIAQATVQIDQSSAAQDEAALAQAQAAYAQARAQAVASSASIGESGSSAQAQAAQAQAARAAVQAAAATVQQDSVNLRNTVITSPVDGTVVARDVNVGQTVAASLQTPTLFTIAENLAKMEVDINVGEPDIGGVKPGDPVRFTVLAYPNQVFTGTVHQVRINPQTVNNVVTYDVVVYVNNASGKLLPGMTANATIVVASAPKALVVPVSALHPMQAAVATTGTSNAPWGGSGANTAPIATGSDAILLVQRNGTVQRERVHVGLVTSTQAAVTPLGRGALSAGEAVVTGFASGTRASQGNPLAAHGAPGRGFARGIP